MSNSAFNRVSTKKFGTMLGFAATGLMGVMVTTSFGIDTNDDSGAARSSVALSQNSKSNGNSADRDQQRRAFIPLRVRARFGSDDSMLSLRMYASSSHIAKAIAERTPVALTITGASLTFAKLSDDRKQALRAEFSSRAAEHYESQMAQELETLVAAVRKDNAGVQVGVVGLPLDNDEVDSRKRYEDLVAKLDVKLSRRNRSWRSGQRADRAVDIADASARGGEEIATSTTASATPQVSLSEPTKSDSTASGSARAKVAIGGIAAQSNGLSASGQADSAEQAQANEQDDVLQLLAVWGTSDETWDLNHDGIVDGQDLVILLGRLANEDAGEDNNDSNDGSQGGGSDNEHNGDDVDQGDDADQGDSGSGSGSGGIDVLEPGSGFDGLNTEPGARGSAQSPGFGAKAIARFTEVPFITRDSDFYLTVSAYHMTGIERVSFSLDGGPEIDCFDVVEHPETNYAEYIVKIDVDRIAPGYHEVRATAWPFNGTPRVLQGEVPEDGDIHIVNNGNSGFFFNYDPAPTVVYVGGEEGQFQTIEDAVRTMGDSLYGGRIYLSRGEHAWFSSRIDTFKNTEENKVLTVMAAPGVQAHEVFMTPYVPGDGGLKYGSLHLKNMSIITPVLDPEDHYRAIRGYGSNRLMLEGITNTSNDPVYGWGILDVQLLAKPHVEWTKGTWLLDCNFTNVPKGINGVALGKNVNFHRFSADAFGGGPGAVINCTFDKGDTSNGFHLQHPDIIQCSYDYTSNGTLIDYIENRIYADLRVTNNCNQIGHFSQSPIIRNVAFVRWDVDNMYHWSKLNLYAPIDHLILKDMRFRNASVSFGRNYEHVLWSNSLMRRFQSDSRSYDEVFELQNSIIENVHFDGSNGVPFNGATIGPVTFAAAPPPVGVSSNGSGEYIPTYVMNESEIANQFIGNPNVERSGNVLDHFYYDKDLMDLTWQR